MHLLVEHDVVPFVLSFSGCGRETCSRDHTLAIIQVRCHRGKAVRLSMAGHGSRLSGPSHCDSWFRTALEFIAKTNAEEMDFSIRWLDEAIRPLNPPMIAEMVSECAIDAKPPVFSQPLV